jgi:hypothetical protein
MSGINALANAIPDMMTLSKLIFGGEYYFGEKDGQLKDVFPEPAVLKMGMTEADFSNKNLGVGGAIIIAAWLTHKDKGALLSLNLASNCLCGVNEDNDGTFDASGNAACSHSNHNIPWLKQDSHV